MSKSYIVILQYLWCNETGGGIEYTSDCVKFDKRDKAIRHGFNCVKATISTSELSRAAN
ncbi:Uncharacterised protein [Klebsiella pneumoniae]|nr:Uncharacterised protein [Klebsiella pneumoniae]SXZ98721.1 Uncharacterised protein [Klebsiella pneumoniae]SYA26721.1 Uncharacterised protein [Klebsiella pneumoniae]VGA99542.1 Uncharacterised protein [Klebsiella pneumoniae]VGB47838.1 Uncharacterised protein [Klebsiella pneumoniae]